MSSLGHSQIELLDVLRQLLKQNPTANPQPIDVRCPSAESWVVCRVVAKSLYLIDREPTISRQPKQSTALRLAHQVTERSEVAVDFKFKPRGSDAVQRLVKCFRPS
jgi:hypothetical protein